MGGDGADAFESCGRFEEAIVAAAADSRNWRHTNPVIHTQSCAVAGRCHAALGRAAEAVAAFECAITEARRCEMPFLELLALRDMIVHVLDKEGRREEQMAALGGAISRMVLPPSDYTAILDAGLNAEEAAALFRK